MSVISGVPSEAEVHENLQALHLRGQVRVQCFRDAREASARQERRSLGYLSGLRDNKSFLLESAAGILKARFNHGSLLTKERTGELQLHTNKGLNLTNRCTSSPSQHWHQGRQKYFINSSLPVTSVSRGIISHRHNLFQTRRTPWERMHFLWELTDSVFTGFSHTESILWMWSGAKGPSAVVFAVRPSVGP